MSKKIIIILILLFLILPITLFSSTGKTSNSSNTITKTYKLKYISPKEVFLILKPYAFRFSYTHSSPYITVVISKNNVKKFEEELRKLDKPKKNILFKVYTIIASKQKIGERIKDPELSPIVKEIKSLFSFKSYKLDGISSIIVKERSDYSKIKLTSSYNLRLTIDRVKIEEGENGKIIDFRFFLKSKKRERYGNKDPYETLISSQTSVKNNTFFVAGVSSLGNNGCSIILVFKVRIL